MRNFILYWLDTYATFTRFTTCGQGATPRCDAEVRRKVRRQLARARAGSRRPFIVLVLKAVSQPGWIRMDSASQRYLPAPALAPSQTCGQGIPELMVMALSKVPIAQTKKRPKPIEANRRRGRSQSKPIEEEAEEVCVLFSIHGKTGFQFCSDM